VKERSSSDHRYSNSTSDDVRRGLSPELDLESNYPLSDTERSGTGEITDVPDLEGMPNMDIGFQRDSHRSYTPATMELNTPTSTDLDSLMYPSAFDYSFIDQDPNFALTLTHPSDMDGLVAGIRLCQVHLATMPVKYAGFPLCSTSNRVMAAC
jgi:hypothetical protein